MLLDVVNDATEAPVPFEQVKRFFGFDFRPNIFFIDLTRSGLNDTLIDQEHTNCIVIHILYSIRIHIYLIVLSSEA